MLAPFVSSPRRLEILRLVWSTERTAGDIHGSMSDVSFPAVSQHLRALSDRGLVRVRADGRRRWYAADRDALRPLAQYLTSMWDDALWQLKLQAELEHTRRGPRANRPRRRSTRSRRSNAP